MNAAVCLKQMQCLRNIVRHLTMFETNGTECLKRTECLPEANTELHFDLELLVTKQDNLKVATIFMAVSCK